MPGGGGHLGFLCAQNGVVETVDTGVTDVGGEGELSSMAGSSSMSSDVRSRPSMSKGDDDGMLGVVDLDRLSFQLVHHGNLLARTLH
jgi:hypothetical protein